MVVRFHHQISMVIGTDPFTGSSFQQITSSIQLLHCPSYSSALTCLVQHQHQHLILILHLMSFIHSFLHIPLLLPSLLNHPPFLYHSSCRSTHHHLPVAILNSAIPPLNFTNSLLSPLQPTDSGGCL